MWCCGNRLSTILSSYSQNPIIISHEQTKSNFPFIWWRFVCGTFCFFVDFYRIREQRMNVINFYLRQMNKYSNNWLYLARTRLNRMQFVCFLLLLLLLSSNVFFLRSIHRMGKTIPMTNAKRLTANFVQIPSYSFTLLLLLLLVCQ